MKTVGWAATAALVTALFFAAWSHFFSQKGDQLKSNVLLRDTAWSFRQPAPASPALLIDAVEKYHALIKFPFDKGALTAISPFAQVDLEFEYAVQKPSGDWGHIPVVVRVGDGTRSLSYAEILWCLHVEAHKHLHTQDHHYFEGLAPREKAINPGIPAYEVYLEANNPVNRTAEHPPLGFRHPPRAASGYFLR